VTHPASKQAVHLHWYLHLLWVLSWVTNVKFGLQIIPDSIIGQDILWCLETTQKIFWGFKLWYQCWCHFILPGHNVKTLFGLLINIVTIPSEDYIRVFESKFNHPPFKIYCNTNLINYEKKKSRTFEKLVLKVYIAKWKYTQYIFNDYARILGNNILSIWHQSAELARLLHNTSSLPTHSLTPFQVHTSVEWVLELHPILDGYQGGS
jgi:hypothetical protein